MSEAPCPFCGQIHGTACNQSDATNTAVAPGAQQYDWRSSVEAARSMILGGVLADRLAAYIERLEA